MNATDAANTADTNTADAAINADAATNTATAAVTTANNDVGESLSSIASIEAVPIGYKNAANTQAGHDNAIKYIDMCQTYLAILLS